MKVRIKGFYKDIETFSYKNVLLAIEDKKLFTNTIKNILTYDHRNLNEIIIYNDELELVLSKNVILIKDIFSFEINSKTILNKLYLSLKQIIEESNELVNSFYLSINMINHSIINAASEWNFDLILNEQLELETYFKSHGIKIWAEYSTLLEKALLIIEILSEFMPDILLIISHSLDYFDDEEVKEILKYIRYKQIDALFIENSIERESLFEDVYLIDNEFDLIYNKDINSK